MKGEAFSDLLAKLEAELDGNARDAKSGTSDIRVTPQSEAKRHQPKLLDSILPSN